MIEIIRDENKFYEIRGEWNKLLKRSGSDNPYLTHEWLSSWWKAYRNSQELKVVLFKNQGEITGAIPLVLTKDKILGIPVKLIKFFSDHWGRMDFILTESKSEHIEEFFNWFRNEKPADALILSRIPEDSENINVIEEVLKSRGNNYEKKKILNSIILLGESWESFLKGLTKKFRYEIKNKQKKLFSLGDIQFERITEVEDQDRIITTLKSVGEKSWKYKDRKGISVSREGEQFYRNIMSSWGRQDKLDISILRKDNLPIAFAVRIKHNHTYYALETAYNQDFYSFSPGLVVQSILLERLFADRNIKKYELGETNDTKRRWSKEYSPEVKLNIYNKTAKMSLCFRLNKMKNLLKRKKNNVEKSRKPKN